MKVDIILQNIYQRLVNIHVKIQQNIFWLEGSGFNMVAIFSHRIFETYFDMIFVTNFMSHNRGVYCNTTFVAKIKHYI